MAKSYDISAEIKAVLDEQVNATLEAKERALTKASEYMLTKLEAATPTDTGATKRSWVLKDKYKGVRYIYNERVNNKNIPVVNLLEFGRKGKPFVRKTFNAEKNKIIEIIQGEIENGN